MVRHAADVTREGLIERYVAACPVTFRGRLQTQKVKKDSSFLKKRSKRLLIFRSLPLRGHVRDLTASAGIKVFWFFSSEKNIFSSTRLANLLQV
jgi:hypothetical protein